MRRIFSSLCIFCAALRLLAHDVVWPENPDGRRPSEAMVLDYPDGAALVRVQPVIGEPCTVVVNLDALDSTLVRAEIITGNPEREVDIRVTVLRAPANGSESVVLGGEWHATGLPENNDCTSIFPNHFFVPIKVVSVPAGPEMTGISPMSAEPGREVTITGSGFTGVTEVSFGGITALYSIISDSEIRAVVPLNAPVGRITINTPRESVTSLSPFVVLPELKVTIGTDGRVVVSWNDRRYPFTLQNAPTLGNPQWQDLITTIDSNVVLPANRTGFYRLVWMQIPLDLTDYNQDRPGVTVFYNNDPAGYWAAYGIPALARLALIRQQVNTEPFTPFTGFMQGYNENQFLTALQNNQLPNTFATLASNSISAGNTASNAFMSSMLSMVVANDATNQCSGDTFRTNCFNANTTVFRQVITNTMDTTRWSNWAPQSNKVVFNTGQFTNRPPINWVDVHGSDSFATNSRPVTPPNDDDVTSFKIKWGDITSPHLWNTTYDAACVAVAVGTSLAKLGVGPQETTCRFWNELSKEAGATPGKLGAPEDGIAALYKRLGYGCSAAYDGPVESAVEEAKKALERGCDVQIEYINQEDTKAHEEVVLGITIDPKDSSKATISTLSWGENATVTYSGGITGGSYSGKSDGRRYRKTGETSSYLEGTGTAILRYYCKE